MHGPGVFVLYRDELLVVVDKPSGMLIHRGMDRAPIVLVDLVRRATGRSRVHPIGRLDRGASGIVLFALDPDVARTLQAEDLHVAVEKTYLVLVRGEAPEDGIIDHPIPRRPGGPRVAARTAWRRLAVIHCAPRALSLLEVTPHTGRLHQIRRHLKHANHPVVGDTTHGRGPLNRACRELYALHRLALHAHTLRVRHPGTGDRVRVTAPLPEDLAAPLTRMGLDWARVSAQVPSLVPGIASTGQGPGM